MKLLQFIKKTTKVLAAAAITAVLAQPAQAETLGNGSYGEPSVDAGLFAPIMAPIAPLLGGAGSTTLISQVGADNTATAMANGAGSLALIAQQGDGNAAYQSVVGNNSAALLLQGGTGNSVLQMIKGDRDVQLVGVSGANNQVAYLQYGNDLAGALDVTNSNNSAVFALQTEQSGRYLMPSGFSGLNNQVVIIVPGRMYVLPRN